LNNRISTGFKDTITGEELYFGDKVHMLGGEFCQGYHEIDTVFEISYETMPLILNTFYTSLYKISDMVFDTQFNTRRKYKRFGEY